MTSSGCVLIFLEKPAAWQKLFPPSLPAKVSQYIYIYTCMYICSFISTMVNLITRTPSEPSVVFPPPGPTITLAETNSLFDVSLQKRNLLGRNYVLFWSGLRDVPRERLAYGAAMCSAVWPSFRRFFCARSHSLSLYISLYSIIFIYRYIA